MHTAADERASLPPIPSHWRWAPLGEVADVRLGKMLSRKAFEPDLVQLPYLRNQNVQWFSIDLVDLKTMGFRKSELERYRVLPGDLLVCEGGEPGRAAVYKGGVKNLMYQKALHRIRPRDGAVSAAFLQYFLARHSRGSTVLPRRSETTIKHLPLEKVKRVPVSLPPVEEQQRIVDRIDELFSDLDAGVAALERAKANLVRYRAAVLKAAVEGKLTEQWRREHPDVEPASELLKRILVERRKEWENAQVDKPSRRRYREPESPDRVGLPSIPATWCWATTDQLTDERRAITYGVVKLGRHVAEGVPTLRSSNVRHLRLDLGTVKRIAPRIAEKYKRTQLCGGEVLITVRGTLGGVAVVPLECRWYNISREVAMLALIEPTIGPTLATFIGAPQTQNWILRNTRGIAYTGLNIATLKRLPLPIAPLEEMQEIERRVSEQLSLAEHGVSEVAEQVQRVRWLRQSLLRRAFSGGLIE